MTPAAGAVVAAQGTLTLLFFLGHGSYHSGMSHHTGNFRLPGLEGRPNVNVWPPCSEDLERCLIVLDCQGQVRLDTHPEEADFSFGLPELWEQKFKEDSDELVRSNCQNRPGGLLAP